MKTIMIRIIKLVAGLFLYSVGIVMTINANLGLAPWDVFHQGLGYKIGITMGQASIVVGVIIVFFNFFFGERIGWGTLSNMVAIGLFLDIIMYHHLIPTYEAMIPSLLLLLSGMFVIGIASYFYISAGFGSGPRDGLMIALTKKTGRSVRFVRNSIEISALVIGYFLGGRIGIGTVITSVAIGYFIQFAFKLFKFDVRTIRHRFIGDDAKALREMF